MSSPLPSPVEAAAKLRRPLLLQEQHDKNAAEKVVAPAVEAAAQLQPPA